MRPDGDVPPEDECLTCGHRWEIARTGAFTVRLARSCPRCGADLTDPHRFDIPAEAA